MAKTRGKNTKLNKLDTNLTSVLAVDEIDVGPEVHLESAVAEEVVQHHLFDDPTVARSRLLWNINRRR